MVVLATCMVLGGPRTSPGPPSCPHLTHTSATKPVRVTPSSNLRGPGLLPHLHCTAPGFAALFWAKTKQWPLPGLPLSSLFSPSLSPHSCQGPLFLTQTHHVILLLETSPSLPINCGRGQQTFICKWPDSKYFRFCRPRGKTEGVM